ncbi:signal peptide peptidase SppA [Pontibacillus litoralis]|uniref:Signal peptide protein n=1 Tax=Pontibacillus litoralis JSM 072002 TaxID=1385512 RepID=A0A0A5G863_9BACI|nr:signal peptide peptidase SppA [Pontibacillus litoralis]KGX87363.1 signal peptide protein [Pontibacillus litoralis JSM 072002]
MKKRMIALVIAASILFVGIIFQAVGLFMTENFTQSTTSMLGVNEPAEKVVENGDLTNRIAMIDVDGTIMNTAASPFGGAGYQHEQFLEELETIKEDASIKGVLLNVNSPGGGVYESAEIHDKLLEIKEADKSLYVSMGSMAASGGYYIAAPADQIYASKETLTGSLGVIMQSVNYQELADKFGIKYNTFKSGEFKDIMNPMREMTKEEKAIMQEMVDESYEQFVQIISEGRDMPKGEVKRLADGRIYSGQQAVENGLVDEIGFQEDALLALKEEIGGNPQIIEYDAGFGTLFGMPLAENILPNSEARMVEQLLKNRQGPKLMYMYTE